MGFKRLGLKGFRVSGFRVYSSGVSAFRIWGLEVWGLVSSPEVLGFKVHSANKIVRCVVFVTASTP